MPQLLLEIFSEEIPARMQAKAETDLLKAVESLFTKSGVGFGETLAWSGPRRLGVCFEDVATKSEDVREVRKGPKVGAPEKAIAGFLRGAGLASVDDAEIVSDPKKGEFYQAIIERPGQSTKDILAASVPDIIRGFHWPKSMRWGRGELRWVRPLQRILCLFEGKIVPFEVDGLKSGDEAEGHRIHGRGPYNVKNFKDYQATLESQGHVLLNRAARRARIEAQSEAVCAGAELELIPDEGLMQEVTGLAEWPVVILGEMDPAFLDLPPEVIRLSMRVHQKYFALRPKNIAAEATDSAASAPNESALAPNFLVVANLEASDGGDSIAKGNARVLSARLNDARFFWDNDRKTPLKEMAAKLSTITFHAKLGTIADKVERVAALARDLAPAVGADPDLAERAARLSKADLVSEMVYEFPELQGVMGGYYARLQKEPEAVANAIRDHYKPQGPSDAVPADPVSIAVALADKLDTLVGFWAIDEKPTGSGDPYALRRAALGVIRIVLGSRFKLQLSRMLLESVERSLSTVEHIARTTQIEDAHNLEQESGAPEIVEQVQDKALEAADERMFGTEHRLEAGATVKDLLAFFADRLKVHLRSEGQRHDLIDAVFALGEDDLVLIVKRVESLGRFLDTDDGANLLAGYKRAANILKAEEKKDKRSYHGAPDPDLFLQDEERALHAALVEAQVGGDAALKQEDFDTAMGEMATLRAPVDAFFDRVTVNADDTAVRQNRLLLLASIRDALHRVADFSKVEG